MTCENNHSKDELIIAALENIRDELREIKLSLQDISNAGILITSTR